PTRVRRLGPSRLGGEEANAPGAANGGGSERGTAKFEHVSTIEVSSRSVLAHRPPPVTTGGVVTALCSFGSCQDCPWSRVLDRSSVAAGGPRILLVAPVSSLDLVT